MLLAIGSSVLPCTETMAFQALLLRQRCSSKRFFATWHGARCLAQLGALAPRPLQTFPLGLFPRSRLREGFPAMNAIPDSDILKSVHDRLQRAGASQERIRATVDHGTVKLMGALQFEMQRRAYLKVVSAIAGVGRVDDHMQVSQKKKK